jgi:hypothetical protein
MRQMMGQLKLMVNEEKTRTCRLPEEEFDFLGYTFGQRHARRKPSGLILPPGRRGRASGA